MRDAQAGDARPSRLRSTVTAVRKQKGRGFRESMDVEDDRSMSQQYESLENTAKLHGAQKCMLCLPSGTLCSNAVYFNSSWPAHVLPLGLISGTTEVEKPAMSCLGRHRLPEVVYGCR